MARDLYGSAGSVPDTAGLGGGPAQPYQNLRVNADMFGANIGEANLKRAGQTMQSGKQAMDYLTEEAAKATEAKTNDWYANQYVPRAIELRTQFDMLDDRDKIAGYESYKNQLKALNDENLKGASGYERELRTGLVQKHQINEMESSTREMVEAQKKMAVQAGIDKIFADGQIATNNYNNPALVADTEASIDSTIDLMSMDEGLNPANETDGLLIQQRKETARGDLALSMIDRALQSGDATSANQIRAKYAAYIPGYKQEQIDKVLASENIRQTCVNGVDAIMKGTPFPQPVGYPPITVQALVADTFQAGGVDPNEGLTVAMIESAMGQNTGTRGTLGQDKATKGQPIENQAQALLTNWKEAKAAASKALGRDAKGWEAYATYQQGVGGGPALLKASTENPTAKAVDVIAPLYKSRKTAIEAITHNGGNLSMTSGDFLQMIEKKYARNMALARVSQPVSVAANVATPEGVATVDYGARADGTKKGTGFLGPIKNADGTVSTEISVGVNIGGKEMEIPTLVPTLTDEEKKYLSNGGEPRQSKSIMDKAVAHAKERMATGKGPFLEMTETQRPTIGDTIRSAYEQTGETVQPAATPMGELAAFQQKKALMMERILANPNEAIRNGAMSRLNDMEGVYKAKAEAYKGAVYKQAEALQYNEGFTSLDQVPAQLRATLQTEFPDKWIDLRTAANTNKGFKSNPVALGELQGRVNNLFDTRTKKDGSLKVTIKEGGLENSVRLQDEIMTASDRGIISGEEAKAMIKTININMAALAGGEKIKVEGSSHYEDAYKDFVKSGATPTEINRMFHDYVVAADQYKFDQQQPKDGLMDRIANFAKYGLGPVPVAKDQPGQVTPSTTVQAILKAQATQRYEGLTMLPAAPNAAIGRDGSSMAMSSAPPEGSPDTAVKITAKRMKDNVSGAEAIVYYNPDGTVFKIEEL